MKVKIQFDRAWFFAQDSHMLSVKKVVELVRREVDNDASVVKKELTECILDLPGLTDAEAADQQIRALISKKICQDAGNSQPFYLKVFDGEEAKADEPAAPNPVVTPTKPAAKPAPEPKPVEKQEKRSALEDANDLVGVEEFKRLCQDIHARAQRIRDNGTQDAFLSTAYLFVGNEGFGCEKAISILDALLQEEGLFSPGASPLQLRLEAPPEPLTKTNLGHAFSAPRLVTIDLSAVTEQTQSFEFKKLMMELFRRGKKCLVIFRAPYMGQEMIKQICEDLSDVLSVQSITFPLFTDAQLRELAERSLAAYGFSAQPQAWEPFQKVIEQESMDGYFYGVHTVRKVADEMIQAEERLQAEKASEAGNERQITAEAVGRLLRKKPDDADESIEQLDQMIGMSDVAKKVKEMIHMVMLTKHSDLVERPVMHMCFTGNPGTGKTTVARMVGKALKDAGVLRVGKFVEHHARDLCAKYVGHTAPLTASICRDAYGSVLFLDEAYALASSDFSGDYGQEALDTLIAQMENHRDDLVVIFAGYPREMERFLEANPGMRTRIPFHIDFPNYTRDELFAIFKQMAERRFRLGEGFLERAEAFFTALPKELMESRSFGNGRFVRNLYERVCSKAAMRSSGMDINGLILEVEDFDAAAAELPMPKQVGIGKIGF